MTIRKTRTMSDAQMMQVQRELGSITQALKNAEDYRSEVLKRLDDQNGKSDELSRKLSEKIDQQNEKIDAMRGALNNVESALKSTSTVVAGMAVEKCGDRLDKLEAVCKTLPSIESEVMFWRRLLGGTFSALWKIVALVLGSEVLAGYIFKHWIK
jgi:chromosome segregation ATPase